tara:strand:- start:884 stop:1492 length:609 start_codon:yes stop_codon:yes gene_type:complete
MLLVVENLCHAYSPGKVVLDTVSIEVGDGEIVGLVGPSGCGKSTFLHCIAGLLAPTSGTIEIEGKNVTRKKPHQRGIGIMMQDQPLYEHLSIEQNIAFPLQARGEKKPSVLQIIEQLGLTKIAKQKVSSCSGGERRRVAFGRAVVTKPSVLLLDEPFVSLNEELRERMNAVIVKTDVSTIIVTHDIKEATALCDRVIEMEKL